MTQDYHFLLRQAWNNGYFTVPFPVSQQDLAETAARFLHFTERTPTEELDAIKHILTDNHHDFIGVKHSRQVPRIVFDYAPVLDPLFPDTAAAREFREA